MKIIDLDYSVKEVKVMLKVFFVEILGYCCIKVLIKNV